MFDNPKTFEQAWDHQEEFQQKLWRKAINKEFSKMESKNVWKKIKHVDMVKERQCVRHKWVFEIKRSGILGPSCPHRLAFSQPLG